MFSHVLLSMKASLRPVKMGSSDLEETLWVVPGSLEDAVCTSFLSHEDELWSVLRREEL